MMILIGHLYMESKQLRTMQELQKRRMFKSWLMKWKENQLSERMEKPIITRTFEHDVIHVDCKVPHCVTANSSWQK